MGIRVVCPNGHVLQIKPKYAGKNGICPICKTRIKVPDVMEVLEPEEGGLSVDSLLLTEGPTLSIADKWQIAAGYLYDLLTREIGGERLKDQIPKKDWEEAIKRLGNAEEDTRFPSGAR